MRLVRLLFAVGLLMSHNARAQNAPAPLDASGHPQPITAGQVWTPAMWVAAFSNYANALNGSLTMPAITGGSISGTAVTASSLTAPDGDHNAPQHGILIGYAQSAYPVNDPGFNGSVNIHAPAPAVNLYASYGGGVASLFFDRTRNVTLQSNVTGGRVNVVTTQGALQVQDTASAAALWLVPASNVLVPITADTGGGLALGNGATNSSLYLNFQNIRFGTTFDSSPADCGNLTGSIGCLPIVTSNGTAGLMPVFKKGS